MSDTGTPPPRSLPIDGHWLVWETECPGEGSTLIAAPTLAYAKAVYWVGCGEAFEQDPVSLDGCAVTAEMLEIRGEIAADAVVLGHSVGWPATPEEMARVLALGARAAVTHELKIWPGPFEAVLQGTKTHEVRAADRPFAVGDVLILREWAAGYYTGRTQRVDVTYLSEPGTWGLPADLCVMSIRRPADV